MTKKIRILSIDGGGIRGIIPGTIIAYIESEIRKREGGEKRISDYFDLIAGTSTGGILTCAYLTPSKNGRPLMMAKQAVDIYLEKGKDIFTKKSFSSIKKLLDEQYDETELEKALKDTFGDTKLKDLLKPCLISSYDIHSRKSKFFNSVDANKPMTDFYVREIARATSAAPTYFEAAYVTSIFGTGYPLIDGGVVANNPSMCAYAEARNLNFSEIFNNPDKPDKPGAQDMVLISIGTGSENTPYNFEKAKDWGTIEWIQPIIDIMMSGSSEIVNYQLQQLFDVTDSSSNYYRLEPSRYHASADMDDASRKNLLALEEAGRKYIEDNIDYLDEIIDKLIANH